MIVVLVAMIVFGFCVVLHQLFKLQVVEGEALQARALQQQLRSERIGAKRGTIYDTNGNPLAKSATVWSVCVAPGLIDTPEKESDVTAALEKFLELDKESIQKKLALKGTLYQVVKTKVEKPQADELMTFVSENGLTGLIFLEQDTRRYYPYGNFASAVLGFANDDNHGAYGLESYYEKVLAGTPGRVVSMKNSRGVDMDLQYSQEYAAKDGDSLVLTIDETIQHFLEKNLEIALPEHKVRNRVTGVVMDVKTGAVLAMASKPDFDPNNPYEILDDKKREELENLKTVATKEQYDQALREAWYAQWRNYAISDPYEPGSVFKIITASGALECGAVTRQSTFYCSGATTVNGTPYHCWVWGEPRRGPRPAGPRARDHELLQPGVHRYRPAHGRAELRRILLQLRPHREDGHRPAGEATSIYHARYTINDLASSSFGQTFKVTPIQLITAASAAVNGGKLMQPYIVKQIVDAEGNVISNTEPVVKRQVVSEDISKEMRLMLEQVVANGSGRQAQIPGYRVGGKTGTSEQLDSPKLKSEGRTPNTLSFFGFAPVEDPQVACLVLIDDPDIYNAYGSTVAAPIVGAVLADTLPYMGIEPQYTEEELANVATKAEYLINLDLHDAQYKCRVSGLKYRVVGNGTKVLRQIPEAGETIPEGGTIVLYTEEEGAGDLIPVPDVVGKTVEEANRSIVGAGLNISISGEQIEGTHQVVSSQTPAAGEQVEAGTVVTIQCVESTAPVTE